jgi:hypothetical protein
MTQGPSGPLYSGAVRLAAHVEYFDEHGRSQFVPCELHVRPGGMVVAVPILEVPTAKGRVLRLPGGTRKRCRLLLSLNRPGEARRKDGRPRGRNPGRQWGISMAASGEVLMAAVSRTGPDPSSARRGIARMHVHGERTSTGNLGTRAEVWEPGPRSGRPSRPGAVMQSEHEGRRAIRHSRRA